MQYVLPASSDQASKHVDGQMTVVAYVPRLPRQWTPNGLVTTNTMDFLHLIEISTVKCLNTISQRIPEFHCIQPTQSAISSGRDYVPLVPTSYLRINIWPVTSSVQFQMCWSCPLSFWASTTPKAWYYEGFGLYSRTACSSEVSL